MDKENSNDDHHPKFIKVCPRQYKSYENDCTIWMKSVEQPTPKWLMGHSISNQPGI